MRRFILYRHNPPATHTEGHYANPPEEPQLEGCEFGDGTVAVRWCTPLRSTSLWADFDTFDKVHGHPEYSSELVWLD